jgi:tRNA nucleotidyltransferase (CCA-adding enzyme)
MLRRLPRRFHPILSAARAVARTRRLRIYLAGGAVRDLRLGRPIADVDLVVEADALGFAKDLASRLSGSLKEYPRFATATLTLSEGSTLDVAATRTERYGRPGALPAVTTGVKIEEDLGRRDFTVNAMALELSPGRRLVDPFGGEVDLERRNLRSLHGGSFLDDPTRALRAVRYANRLGFRIERATRRQIAVAVETGAFSGVSGDRMRRELRLIFEEPRRASALAAMLRLGIAHALDPALCAAASAAARVRRAETLAATHGPSVTWLCYLLAWMSESGERDAVRVSDRLGLAGAESRTLRAWAGVVARCGPGLAALPVSELSRRTRGLSSDEIVAAAARLPAPDRRALLAAASPSMRVRLTIRGTDLRAAGVPAGPAIGRALASTLAAREDGRIEAAQELAFALRAAGQFPA